MGENKFRTHDIISEEKKSCEYSRYSPVKVSKQGEKKEPKRNKQKATLRIAFNFSKT